MKGTKFYSIFKGRCPRCQSGDFFEGNFFRGTPRRECPSCKLKYEKEPGFFQGSYYVTYSLGVATIVAVTIAMLVLFPDASFNTMMYTVLGSIILLTPFTYPLSKIIWANFFTAYEAKYSKNDTK